jgi:hypothetical protein
MVTSYFFFFLFYVAACTVYFLFLIKSKQLDSFSLYRVNQAINYYHEEQMKGVILGFLVFKLCRPLYKYKFIAMYYLYIKVNVRKDVVSFKFL